MNLYNVVLFECVLMNLYNVVAFNRMFQSSSEEESGLGLMVSGVGKSNDDDNDEEDYDGADDCGDDKDDVDDDDNDSSGKKVKMIWVMQLFHLLMDFTWSKITVPNAKNVGSNFVGLTSHVALKYLPPLGPFSEYDAIDKFGGTVWYI
jgi:hypothetical protein